MRNLRALDRYRRTDAAVIQLYGNTGDETCGVFEIPSPIDRAPLRIVASVGEGWDHVSVSRQNRVPNYLEMQAMYKVFFREDETAMQLHVPESDHVNYHTNCLHLWRPLNAEIPRPDAGLVGPKPEAAE